MAGYRTDEEVDFEDAIGIASLLAGAGRVPPPAAWVSGLIVKRQDAINESFAENFF
jgi:hypothetical protein